MATELVSRTQAKAHLNLSSSTTSDTELDYFIGVSSDLVEDAANRVWRDTTYTAEQHRGGRDVIVLEHSPVAQITELRSGGSVVDESAYSLDASTGLIRLLSGVFAPDVEVDYSAGVGDGPVPALAQHATLETLRHLWATQRGTVSRSQRAGDDYAGQPTTFSLPLRVVELIDRLSLSAGIG